MPNEVQDVRCAACGKLLARMRDGQLMVQRGDLQATFDGEFQAAFVCGQPRCRHLNLLRIRAQQNPSPTPSR
jgi:phage FluMu protein Com